jgi:hypothetical protein
MPPLDALTNRCRRAARSKDEFANTATGKCQMLALPATATDFQLPTSNFQLPTSKGARPLLRRGLFGGLCPVQVGRKPELRWAVSGIDCAQP